jgi:hypothetical protein
MRTIVAGMLTLALWPQTSHADCREVCMPDEQRDTKGCCVPSNARETASGPILEETISWLREKLVSKGDGNSRPAEDLWIHEREKLLSFKDCTITWGYYSEQGGS